MPETVFDELKRYLEFGPEDEEALRALHPFAAPRFAAIAETFYARILAHEAASRALQGGEQRVGHLKVTLAAWMDRLLRGPWDDAYFQARCRIGHMHVRIGLAQHYMFGAMNVIRRGLDEVIDDAYQGRPAAFAARRAVGKILDLELAVMLETYREDLLMQQARVERLSTFGQLVGSIAHDLRNPLGAIETSLYILRRLEGGEERTRRHVQRIGEQLRIANGIIEGLLEIIRERPVARQEIRIAAVVDGAAGAVHRPEGVRIALEGLGELPAVQGDPGQLRQVFVNLLQNAVDAVSPTGEIRVRGSAGVGRIEVAVEDTGPGVDAATARRLFEPLTTSKDRGTGLGLALVKRIVERHGGEVSYERRDQGGARFSVSLPA